MLEKFEQIQGIGLLHDVNGKPFRLHKAALIYADNGRGKSTLASLLRSASTGDASLIDERRTIDGKLNPKVALQFGSGHKVTFSDGAWTERRAELLVFDAAFIEKNVHSGGAVSAGHRKNLLEFALGAAAVSARNREDQTTTAASAANTLVKQLTAQLIGFHQGLSLAAFEKLAKVPDADAQIEALQQRIVAAGSIGSILSRPLPVAAEEPKLDLDALFGILNTSLDDIQEDAERLVRDHVAAFDQAGAEDWLSSGQQFDNGSNCPYCRQDTSGIALVRAYRTHFNVAYTKLKNQVSLLERGISVRTGTAVVEAFAARISTANATVTAWAADVKIDPIAFDQDAVAAHLAELQKFLSGLVAQKQDNPTASVGNASDKVEAEHRWNAIHGLICESNRQVSNAKSALEQFRARLTAESTNLLQGKIAQLQAAKRRFEPEVLDLFKRLATAKHDSTESERNKKKARDELDLLMTEVLGTYEKSINALLQKFGASFQIEKMDANFRGGAPRSEYGLCLRGKSVPLEGGTPRFATALSEGDKRTLAFAFFIATTLADPELANRIVVIDDPMCSLDANRKHHTKTVLKQIHSQSDQLIVLAHDPYFIRDVRDELTHKDGQSQVSVLQLRHSSNDYSEMDKFDVDQECESPYYRHHRMLAECCAGGAQDSRSVAKTIRPFLEGYLHRRFPGLIPRDLMFGLVLTYARDAVPPSPVVFAQPLITELQEINDYAGQFHHDTNPGNADTVQVIATELRGFCTRALKLVHSGVV